jgi:hypothetical protein
MGSKATSSEKGMKSKFLLAAFIALAILALAVGTAFAGWTAIKNSGYAVTTNWHGIDVPGGQVVVATAGTTDQNVKKIEFIWKNASEFIIWDENITVSGPLVTSAVPGNVPQEVVDWANSKNGVKYWYAQSSHTPIEVGDWGVQVRFFKNGLRENEIGSEAEDFVVRATSFNTVPETPWGPIAISATFLGALGLFVFRKKLPLFRAQGIR